MLYINITHRPFVSWDQHSMTSRAVGWLSLIVTILAGATYNSFAKQLTGALASGDRVCPMGRSVPRRADYAGTARHHLARQRIGLFVHD